jgi:hypothetical protein
VGSESRGHRSPSPLVDEHPLTLSLSPAFAGARGPMGEDRVGENMGPMGRALVNLHPASSLLWASVAQLCWAKRGGTGGL